MSDLQNNPPVGAATHLKRKTNVIFQLPKNTSHKHFPHSHLMSN